MKCNWCGKGKGRNYSKDKETGMIYYYYCLDCHKDCFNGVYLTDNFKEVEK